MHINQRENDENLFISIAYICFCLLFKSTQITAISPLQHMSQRSPENECHHPATFPSGVSQVQHV